MKKIRSAFEGELDAIRKVEWGRLEQAFTSPSFVVALFIALFLFLISATPAVLFSSDSTHLLGYLVASQVLVHLAWAITAWMTAGFLGVLAVTVLIRRPGWVTLLSAGKSVARISAWTGRLGVPILLGSTLSWTFGLFDSPALTASPGSVLKQIAVLQAGLLLTTLTSVVAFESVHMVFQASRGLPATVRVLASMGAPLAGWEAARHVEHFYPLVERLFTSITPADRFGVPNAELAHELHAYLVYVPWQVGVGISAIFVAILVLVERKKSIGDARA